MPPVTSDEDLDQETPEQKLAREAEEAAAAEAELDDDNEEGEDSPVEIVIEGENSALSEEEIKQNEELEKAPQWVKDLRKKTAEDAKKIKQLETEKQALLDKKAAEAEPEAVELGEKPTLAGCDYDEEVLETQMQEWLSKKSAAEAKANQVTEAQKKEVQAYQDKLASYKTAKAAMKLDDFDEAEATVLAALSTSQQGIIIAYAKNPAAVAYALGKNPKILAELASIHDPIKYAFALNELEGKIKVNTRKAPPAPEAKPRGNGSVTSSGDKELDRLRKEAETTGNYTKVSAYKRQMKAAKK